MAHCKTMRETKIEKSANHGSWRKCEARLEGPHGEVEAGYRPREQGPSSQAFIGVLVSSAGLVNSNQKEQGFAKPHGAYLKDTRREGGGRQGCWGRHIRNLHLL